MARSLRSFRTAGFNVLLALLLVLGSLLVAAPAHAEGVGKVRGRSVSVLAGPGARFWSVAILRQNQAVPVTGISVDRQFWQVRTSRGTGFVSINDVTVTGGADLPTVTTDVIGAVTAARANVRLDPGIEGAGANTLTQGTQFFAIGRTEDSSWIEIRYKFGTGWIRTSLTNVNAAALPVVVGTPRLIVNVPFINVRSGPSADFSSLGVIRGGGTYPILGISEDGAWFYIKTAFGEGWINKIYVITRDYFGGAKVIAGPALDKATYTGTIITGSAAVREAPGLTFKKIGSIVARTEVVISGQSADKAWWYVTAGKVKGWVSKALVRTSAASDNVPVIN